MFLNNGEIRISFALFIRLKFQGFRCESVLSLSLKRDLKLRRQKLEKQFSKTGKDKGQCPRSNGMRGDVRTGTKCKFLEIFKYCKNSLNANFSKYLNIVKIAL